MNGSIERPTDTTAPAEPEGAAAAPAPVAPGRVPSGVGLRALLVASRYGGLVLFVVLFVVFAVTLPDTFFTAANLRSVAASYSVPGMLALGLLLPLVAGEFDFSVGATLSGAMVTMGILTGEHGWSWPAAAGIAVAGAVVVGLVNGVLVARFGINSFVATLAVSGIIGGRRCCGRPTARSSTRASRRASPAWATTSTWASRSPPGASPARRSSSGTCCG